MVEKLKRELRLVDIFCIATGAMISSGLFILPALAFSKTGPAVITAYFLAGILAIPALLSKAELSTAMPKAGGTYFFIDRTLGPAAGTFGGFANWFSISFKSAFALIGMGVFAVLIYPQITVMQIKIIAVAFCLLFAFLNYISVKETGKFQVYFVFLLLGLLLIYVITSLNFVEPDRFVPFNPYGLRPIFAAAGLVFVSFGGLTKVASIAEEVKNPERNLPLGMFLAFLITGVMYFLVVFVTVGIVDGSALKQTLVPISLGASVSMGKAGVIIMAVAALLAFITTANAGLLSASRFPLAMSRDQLLPEFFRKINLRFKTPHVSIFVTSGFMIMVILFFSLENLIKTASTLMLLLFMSDNLAVIIMRESKIHSYRPKFRAPLYPWLQIAGIGTGAFVIFEMGTVPLAITGGFIIIALIWYFLYARFRVERQSALMHIMERVTAKELQGATLQSELRDIIIERDNIVEDRFDRIIKQCEILDIDHSLRAEELLRQVAIVLSKRLATDQEELYRLFLMREKDSSTVIAPGLAIPHIVVDGTEQFDIILVRCQSGIHFPNVPEPVHSVFVLAGTRDERNFHLRALAAIAQIAQDKDFDKSWLKARTIEELRDIILLAERKRMGIV